MNKAMQWIQNPGRTYSEGVQIYKAVFGMDKFYEFFSNVPDSVPGSLHYNLLLEKIKVADRRLGEQPVELPKAVVTTGPAIGVRPISGKPRFVENNLVEVTKLPRDLQDKFLRNKELVKELAGEHAAMKSAASDQARALHLANSKTLEQEKDSNWKAIDSWWEANKETVSKNESVKPELNIEKRIETVRKAIHRAKSELKDTTMDLKKRNARKAKIQAWEQEMKDLKKQKDA